MYTKLFVFGLFFTAITSYAMLPSHLLRRQLLNTIASHTTKPTPKISPQLTIFEQAAEAQIILREAEQTLKNEIALSSEAYQMKMLALSELENHQKQISGGAWTLDLGLPKRKAPSNRYTAKNITSKSGKRV